MTKAALVVTSIASSSNPVLNQLVQGAIKHKFDFVVIGDRASPNDFDLNGCDFYSLARQKELNFEFAKLCPEKHYARKNIGYLQAIQNGAQFIVETDDDNIPYESFWGARERTRLAPSLGDAGWVNVYSYFSDVRIWPRGLPLDQVNKKLPEFATLAKEMIDCPVQQGLADDNPDVDAIYRLLLPLPQQFRRDRDMVLKAGAWCPFNSQNTTWWPDAYGLLYLPAYCSFRMTDIWRSFVAQRICWANGWGVYFHEATVRQERNEHNLMRDFKDEVPGYLQNAAICDALMALHLNPGVDKIGDNLLLCYQKLAEMNCVDVKEIPLVKAWISDLSQAKKR